MCAGRMAYELEVCVDCVEHALSAERAGATRIEFNSSLDRDGLTPSLGATEYLCRELSIPVVAMVRPHDAGFVYSDLEKRFMLRDAEFLAGLGVQGIVIGALTDDGRVDSRFVREAIRILAPLPVIFHRAFDRAAEPLAALRQLIDLGIVRVLTSGQGPTALEGIELLAMLHKSADGAIEILPGAGINSRNARQILQETGCTQLHGSFRSSSGGVEVPVPGPNASEIRAVLQEIDQIVG